jgi:hypothetical protein
MATNPNRPQYQDTIESAWGQSVADHVVRRYATAAERDADLAGLTAADLEGQVVVIAGSDFPSIEIFHGGAWSPLPDVQAGQAWISTDAGSNAYIPFPRAFAGVPQSVIATAGAGTSGGVTFAATSAVAADRAQVTAWNGTGGAYGAGAVFLVNWIAVYVPGQATATARPAELDDEKGGD